MPADQLGDAGGGPQAVRPAVVVGSLLQQPLQIPGKTPGVILSISNQR
jgi:hypothetical protein